MSEPKAKDLDVFLQRELEEMAAEVPPMTRSFRNGWRQAIRQEAEAAKRIPAEAEAPEEREPEGAAAPEEIPAAPVPEEEPAREGKSGRTGHRRQWTGFLSAAAAVVFLIGGTLLTRGTLSPRLRRKQAVTQAAGTETEAFRRTEALPDAAEDALIPPDAAAEEEVSNAVPVLFAAEEEAAEENFRAEEEAAGEAANALFSAAGSAPEADAALPPEEEARTAGVFAAAVPTADPTAAPAKGNAETGEAEAPEAEPSLWTRSREFLEDMGAFLLAALPWLAGAAAILTALLLLRRKKRTGKGSFQGK